MSDSLDRRNLSTQVRTNLTYHHLWSNFVEYELSENLSPPSATATSSNPTIASSSSENTQSQDDTQNQRNTSIFVLRGQPPNSLDPTEETRNQSNGHSEPIPFEWVLPAQTEGKWSVKQWDDIFEKIDQLNVVNEISGTPTKAERILMAMVTNDSTIVYYFINKGIKKPRKN